MADQVGSLEKNKDATLMITTGDPLEVITNREKLFIQAREIDLNHKHRGWYEKYRQRYQKIKTIITPGKDTKRNNGKY